jgi:TRAP-type C4-dicarboxylate transport system permease small subunit
VEARETSTVVADGLGRILSWFCTGLALLGGIALLGIVGLTIVSIIAREVLGNPIPGDFELVEIGCAIAVFAFLPYCQLVRGNLAVDFVTARTSLRTRAFLEAIGGSLLTAIAAVLTWRLVLGGMDLRNYHEATMVLRIPLWWAFVPVSAAAALLTMISAYTAWQSAVEVAGGSRAEADF